MPNRRTAIVTDSTADIPPSEVAKYNIRVIPALITLEGQSYPDNETFDRPAFYNRLREYQTVPTTASPPPAAFTSVYNELLREGYEQVLSMHVSGKLSAICDMAATAAKDFSDRVQVFDSGQLSMGLGFQVLEAAAAAYAGETYTKILHRLPEVQKRIRVLAMINKLDYLRRSGRVNWVSAHIGTWLHVKMVVGLRDGIVQRMAAVRTRTKALQDISKRVRQWGPLQRLAVLHTGISHEAAGFAETLTPHFTESPLILDATTVIGTHIGEGSIGVAALIR